MNHAIEPNAWDLTNTTDRLVLADLMDEHDRGFEAALLRSWLDVRWEQGMVRVDFEPVGEECPQSGSGAVILTSGGKDVIEISWLDDGITSFHVGFVEDEEDDCFIELPLPPEMPTVFYDDLTRQLQEEALEVAWAWMVSENEGASDEFEDQASFSCPYCGEPGFQCSDHLLGSRDTNFSEGFFVDEGSQLNELYDEFGRLDEAVSASLRKQGVKKWPNLRPARLKSLIESVSESATVAGNEVERDSICDGTAFADYLTEALRDTRLSVRFDSTEVNNGPGFASRVELFWARNPQKTLAGLRLRVRQDIQRLAKSSR